VEAGDLLANEVQISWPVAFEFGDVFGLVAAVAYGGHVVGQGVQPDVDHVAWVPGDRDAPFDAGAGDRQVFECAGNIGCAGSGLFQST